MAYYILLAIEDDQQAKILVQDILKFPQERILTPIQENDVHATVRAVFKKPTLFCEDPAHTAAHWTRGEKFGLLICGKCGKSSKTWAQGSSWYTALGTNLLPQGILPYEENIPRKWEKPATWDFLVEGTNG